jgi:DNA-directed RNA polymerase specialized sigma24 family protein
MKTHSNLTEEQFRRLLAWLGPDADAAGERYEFIRQGLITFFVNRRCLDAEDLADETINRVAEKLEWLADSYEGEPERYFYGVAKNVFLEYVRRKRLPDSAARPPDAPAPLTEVYHACLEACLKRLTPENRELILAYYAAKTQKAGARRKLREQLSINAGALRARTFRVRAMLEKCVRDCMAGYTET